jgi:hypothetical protein
LYAITYCVVTEDKTTREVGRAGVGRLFKKRSSILGLEVGVGIRVSVWIRVIVIVDPLQPNTLLHTMALQRQYIDYWLQRAERLAECSI